MGRLEAWRQVSRCYCPDEYGLQQVATFVFKLEVEPQQIQKSKTSLADLLGSQTGSLPFNEKHDFGLSHLGWKGLLVSHLHSNTLTLTLPCTTELFFSNSDSFFRSLARAHAAACSAERGIPIALFSPRVPWWFFRNLIFPENSLEGDISLKQLYFDWIESYPS